MLNTILVPVADDPASENCVHHAFDLSRLLGSKVILLYATENPDDLASGKTLLSTLAAGARYPAKQLVVLDQPMSAVLKAIEVHQVDLVLLGCADPQCPSSHLVLNLLTCTPVPVQVVPMVRRARRGFLDRVQPFP
ncbi:universal stress protein [Deinococcus roseus]|uniref:UspA domain-containing protein n=1 Tax=Deinococcus roseus TaxID=392414 RepID=A0ABQ2CWP6_9DEIO|nr:universal stress protein [Deinococcus roseus]GGJ28510.1 hypothetical protein GCM10008938_13220 [Deinococcus roseus]